MRMELTGTFLTLALLCGATVALADDSKVRGASSVYAWETQEACDVATTIFRVTGDQCESAASTVLVHVNENDDGCSNGDRAHHGKSSRGTDGPRGIILRGCSDECALFVPEGQTVQCVVQAGKRGLRAQSKSHGQQTGTLQVIKI